jgi:glycosyltransferase involved in cell wall biosynthesis
LEILGDGPERERLRNLVDDLQLGHRVRFHGWVDPAARDNWLASPGVLLMPSLWDEAFGMVGVESFAQGTPVIAYDVGGISEWCRGGVGVLVPCGDVRGAAEAAIELTGDAAAWEKRSRAARRLVELQFPSERFPGELDELLRVVA